MPDNNQLAQEQTAALAASEARHRHIIEGLPDGILITDSYGFVTLTNPAAESLFGRPAAEMLGRRLTEFIVPEQHSAVIRSLRAATEGETLRPCDYRLAAKPDHRVEFHTQPGTIPFGDGGSLIHVCRDITHRTRLETTARTAEICTEVQHAASYALARAGSLGEAIGGFLEAVCRQGHWDVGIAWKYEEDERLLRYYAKWHRDEIDLEQLSTVDSMHTITEGQDLPGLAWASRRAIWLSELAHNPHLPRLLATVRAGLKSAFAVPILTHGEIALVCEFYSRESRESDQAFIALMESFAVYVGQFAERSRAEMVLEHRALHDALTALPNRTLLQRRMERAVGAAIESGGQAALLLMDLDRFKEVNDTLGHHFGDLLLQQVSRRLQQVLRDSDTVARLGGDEFAVVLPGSDAKGALLVADHILHALLQPYTLADETVDVGASIGIAVFPGHGNDPTTLMQHADVAMYMAKRGRIGKATYSAEHDQHSRARLSLAAELRQAIDQRLLLLYYQPKVNLDTGRVHSVEALIRWPHPQRGLLPPNEFIPLAEQAALIRPLTDWVLDEAVRQCRIWHDLGLDLQVAVNLSSHSLTQPDLVHDVSDILHRREMDANCLTLEITETAIMADPERALTTLRQFRSLGIKISIDDFGTGYSSLLYLKRLPVDEIKIDKSFILDMASQTDDAFIARTVVDLGHNLGLKVIAEGVQSQQTWDLLAEIGCDYIQGYYLSHPLPASQFATWLENYGVPNAEILWLPAATARERLRA